MKPINGVDDSVHMDPGNRWIVIIQSISTQVKPKSWSRGQHLFRNPSTDILGDA